jgi:predicted HTH transcriptional regulator
MDDQHLLNIIRELITLPDETEWVEFKHNFADPQGIGEYLSALANSAALHGKENGYLLWGVEDGTHRIVGTDFDPRKSKVGNQELESWVSLLLTPRINFSIHELFIEDKRMVLLVVPRAINQPVRFKSEEYIRVGSYKKKLKEYSEKERQLWLLFEREPFERLIAKSGVSDHEVLKLIDYPAYFDLTNQILPDNRTGILEKLISERFVIQRVGGSFDITNLGAILFAKNLHEFDRLSRKVIRVVVYEGKNRVKTLREQPGTKGYAAGFEGAVSYINNLLPQNEVIEQALRKEMRLYPEIAIRELVANAIIHQDFSLFGTGPMIEIFDDRIETTNPGVPLIDTLRFIDEPPQSRNESLASFMRRINICEERGSGIDKVIFAVELYQLPAPDFIVSRQHTKAVLYGQKKLAEMDKESRIRACYQHACLRHVSNDFMTNATLRKRLSISKQNYPMASRIIADTLEANLIKKYDPESTSKKLSKYVPFWA